MPRRTFEEWIDGIFDHPGDSQWFWDADDLCEEEDEVDVEYIARLFADCDTLLRRFDDAQVNQGLTLIVDNSCSNHAFSIVGEKAPWPARRRAIQSIFDVYSKCFAPRCSGSLMHLQRKKDPASNPLNSICYMWWDVFPVSGQLKNGPRAHECDEYLAVMERCLTLPHPACLEGALHGLGHWQHHYPERVKRVIDQFLRRSKRLPMELESYTQSAREGMVQ